MTDKRRVRGVAIHRPIIYGSVATLIPEAEREIPERNMRWTIAVRSAASPSPDSPILKNRIIRDDVLGGQDDLSQFIRKVTFKLHDSYPNPIRTVDKAPFEITETGWGEFVILIKIFFIPEAGEKPIQIPHALRFHQWTEPTPLIHTPWLDPTPDSNEVVPEPSQIEVQKPSQTETSAEKPSSPKPETETENPPEPEAEEPAFQPSIHSWQYDEIVFTEPTDAFYHKLIQHPPTPLPPTNRYGPQYVQQIGSKGESGEFTLDIQEREQKKLKWANLKVLIEIDRLRGKLIRDERELKKGLS
ncbi:yeats family-domain-containing protein [Melampsora americana]|nr:yeats family-domain-containing protein [Melampsora americana]